MCRVTAVFVPLLLAVIVASAAQALSTTIVVSRGDDPFAWRYPSGAEGISESVFVSSNARFAAFVTDARNVFDDDGPSLPVIVVRDNWTGEVTPVTVSTTGGAPNGPSFAPTVTTDGRYVSFCSWADNLVAGDTNNQGDVFKRDLQANTTQRVNVPFNGIWDDRDKTYCLTNAITDDGRYIVFTTASDHMVPNDTNDSDDVFVRDTVANTTTLVSATPAGAVGNASSVEPRIARNGRYVVWMSLATDLVAGTSEPGVRTFRRDLTAATTTLVGAGGLPCVSSSGRYVAYSSGILTGTDAQVTRWDAQTGLRVACSVAPDGTTPGNRDSYACGISDDGRYVCFTSKARNLIAADTNDEADVFVRDLGVAPAATWRVSVANNGLQGNRPSGNASMSADGAYVAFTSESEDLVSLDINRQADVFLYGAPLPSGSGLARAAGAIVIAGGRGAAGPADMGLDVQPNGRIDLVDASRIIRAANGLN